MKRVRVNHHVQKVLINLSKWVSVTSTPITLPKSVVSMTYDLFSEQPPLLQFGTITLSFHEGAQYRNFTDKRITGRIKRFAEEMGKYILCNGGSQYEVSFAEGREHYDPLLGARRWGFEDSEKLAFCKTLVGVLR